MHSRSGADLGGHNNLHLLTYLQHTAPINKRELSVWWPRSSQMCKVIQEH